MAGGLSESLGEEQPSAPRRTNWSAALTILAFLGLVLVPVLVRHTPREVSQWYLAAAIRAQADGPRAAALRYLDESLRWNPDNVDAWLTQAQWRGQERDYEAALASCNRAAELREDDVRVYYERSQILQHLRRGAEAIADWKKIAELNQQRERMSSEQVWNGLAYARAVANLELEAALADAERAVQQSRDRAELLDTRGFILYRLGRYEDARRDLDAAVQRYEGMYNALKEKSQAGTESALEPQLRQRVLRETALGLAVMVYHQSLVYDALGDVAEAEDKRKLVIELGFTPDEDLF